MPLAGSLYRSEYAPVGGSGGAFITPMVYVTIIRLPAMQMEISFRWWRERNPKDYEIKKAGNKPTFTGILRDDWPTIRAKGIALGPYNPLDEFPDLYERFADISSEADAIKFVRAYGPLTHAGLKGKGDPIHIIQRQAESMAAGDLHVGLVLCPLHAVLVAGHDGIILQVKPTNLIGALWLQFADATAHRFANPTFANVDGRVGS